MPRAKASPSKVVTLVPRPQQDPLNQEERASLLAAIENLSPDQQRTLWFLAEHPAVLDIVDRILDVVPEEINK